MRNARPLCHRRPLELCSRQFRRRTPLSGACAVRQGVERGRGVSHWLSQSAVANFPGVLVDHKLLFSSRGSGLESGRRNEGWSWWKRLCICRVDAPTRGFREVTLCGQLSGAGQRWSSEAAAAPRGSAADAAASPCRRQGSPAAAARPAGEFFIQVDGRRCRLLPHRCCVPCRLLPPS